MPLAFTLLAGQAASFGNNFIQTAGLIVTMLSIVTVINAIICSTTTHNKFYLSNVWDSNYQIYITDL